MRCSLVSSALTGRKVPAPTCRVRKCRLMPLASSAASSSSREMQAGGRRRHRALAPGVDGLIALGIVRQQVALAGDVGRQRRIAERLDRLVEKRAVQAEGKLHLAGLADHAHGGIERAEQAHAAVVAEADAVAGSEPLGRPRERAPAMLVHPLVQVEGHDRARIPAQAARPSSAARITLVSLNTSASPGRSSAGRSRTTRCRRAARRAPPAGARHRAGSRAPARCGRRAGRSRTGRCACQPWWQGPSASANRGGAHALRGLGSAAGIARATHGCPLRLACPVAVWQCFRKALREQDKTQSNKLGVMAFGHCSNPPLLLSNQTCSRHPFSGRHGASDSRFGLLLIRSSVATTGGTSSGGRRQIRARRRGRRQGTWRTERYPAGLHLRRDEAQLPRLRHERDRQPGAARCARRPEAGAPPHPVRHAPPGARLEQEAHEVVQGRGRHDGRLPPARQPRHLRRAGAHGAGLLHARAADRRPGQLRLHRRRSAGGRALHGSAPVQDRPVPARRSRQVDGRFPRQLRRPPAGADRPAGQVPQPAGQRLGRHRRRHGHQHPAAQPGRGDRRLHRPPRQPRDQHRRADADRARARTSRPAPGSSAAPASSPPTTRAAARSSCAPRCTSRRSARTARRSSSPPFPTRSTSAS